MGVIRRWTRRLALLGLAGLALAYLAVVGATRWVEARHGPDPGLDPPVDALIVLGAGVDFDFVLDVFSRRRAAAAAEALAEGQARAAIFTGTLAWHWPPTSAGGMMHDHAVALGADPARLHVEPEARTTFENLRFSFRIAEREGYETLAIVSDPYHLTRAYWLAAYLGRPDVRLLAAPGMRHAGPFAAIGPQLREALAWGYNLWKVAAWEAMRLAGYSEAEREARVW